MQTGSLISKINKRSIGRISDKDLSTLEKIFLDTDDKTLTLPEMLKVIGENKYYVMPKDVKAIESLYLQWVDIDGVAFRKGNLVSLSSSSTDWRDGYKKALVDLIVRSGALVALSPGIYSWVDDNGIGKWKAGRKNGEIVGIFNLRESSWNHFLGTFDGSSEEYGLSMDIVLKSGFSREIRLEGSLTKIMLNLLN